MKKNDYKKSKPEPRREARKSKKKKDEISGFSTLIQVSGIPKASAYHSTIAVSDPLKVREPNPVCPKCGKVIDSIADSFTVGENTFVHFDCALAEMKEVLKPAEGQVVSYAGSGNFALFSKDETGRYVLLKSMNYESKEQNTALKGYVESLKE